MRKVYKNRDEEAVSPVIATILMVAITVVLAAVLYVMVINMGDVGDIDTPLGLTQVQDSRNITSVSINVASAPTGAKLTGMVIAMTRAGTPQAITSAQIFGADATLLTTYTPGTSVTNDDAIVAGMTIRIYVAGGIQIGDTISITSDDGYFGASSIQIS